MRSHAKASTAGSTMRQAKGLGRFFRGADADRGASPRVQGTGAPVIRGLVATLASLLLLALTAAPAFAAEPPVYLFSFGPDGTEASDFGEMRSAAVDQQTGAVYVLRANGSLLKFDTDGNPVDFGGSAPYISGNALTGLSLRALVGESQIAVDSASHKIYVTDDGGEALRAFEADGEPSLFTAGPGVGSSKISFADARGVAVDGNGDIYVSEASTERVKVFAASGEPIAEFESAIPTNLAVSSNGVVYVDRSEAKNVRQYTPSEFPPTSTTTYATASEPFHGSGFGSVAVDPATSDVYVGQTASFFLTPLIAWYDEGGTLQATFGGPGEDGQVGAPFGLAVHSGSGRVFVADNLDAKVKVFGPEIIIVDRPTIESTSVSDVAADAATLRAQINPNTFDTTYRFEYGPEDCALSACTSAPAGGAGIEAGHKGVAVSRDISGLLPGTTYHFRVVAQNSEGVREGPDRTFTTQLSGLGFDLADYRAWEMVSPPNKFGATLVGSFRGLVQAAADGNGLAYLSLGSIEADPEGNRIIEPSSTLARRGGGGWHSKDITPPHEKVIPLPVGDLAEYKLFTPDLASAVFQQRDTEPLSPQASERTPYLRHNGEPASYVPLVTGKEGFANVPPGTEFGGKPTSGYGAVVLVGASSDLKHVALQSEVPLAAGAPSNALYAWHDEALQSVSVRPPSEGGDLVLGELGSAFRSLRHAVSEDGSRVFWSAQNLTALYMRDTESEETVRLDVVQPGVIGTGKAEPNFQGASADGGIVFFTDTQQLTADASPSGSDLYRCVIDVGSPSSGCSSLTDLTAPLAGSGESSEVQGTVPAFTDDGSSLYFVAKGVLDSGPNPEGESALAGEPNLYLWQAGEGARFIATLSAGDSPDWRGAGDLAAASSPNGRFFSFMSERSLTGYDNRDAVTDEPAQEAFLYDASADRLECVSCNPTGAVPEARVSEMHNFLPPLADQRLAWEGKLLAASLPEATVNGASGLSLYRPRSVSDSGRTFFNAFDSLVPADSNGQWDVYEYEPVGAGDCTASSGGAAISRSAGGCVSLISSGTAEEEAAFLDASTTGNDVFFLTSAKLSVTDEDSELDVYDARVDGVPATLTPNTECLGEACQPAAIAPNDPTPSSSSFKGQGNVVQSPRKRCAKGKRAVRRGGKARCVARGPHAKQKRHDRAGKSGRAGR